ncbi:MULTISPECIES: flagellar export protein FliJ [Chitinimonas]|uniref:Flagellar FliJ protein n=1 Tax=Chitinimonas prasina TaxID=1434937 RepID=A0ABQ5YHR0_9NEIS|nr:flagellar export protein FliJ [Chitinimonas prasina]GLR14540.1 flagellar FliJ protein [Chitinimonas prasina]
MAKAFQFAFLLELAIDKREDAARAISAALQRLEQARARRAQIEQYREEYRTRLTDTASRGMRIHQWNDFQLFLAKLDTAVEQQLAEEARCEAQLEARKQAWQACEREVKAYETLQDRHQSRETQREAKQDQKLTDEWASILQRRRDASGH